MTRHIKAAIRLETTNPSGGGILKILFYISYITPLKIIRVEKCLFIHCILCSSLYPCCPIDLCIRFSFHQNSPPTCPLHVPYMAVDYHNVLLMSLYFHNHPFYDAYYHRICVLWCTAILMLMFLIMRHYRS